MTTVLVNFKVGIHEATSRRKVLTIESLLSFLQALRAYIHVRVYRNKSCQSITACGHLFQIKRYIC